MNLALFITPENLASIHLFAQAFSKLQTEKVNGGVAIYFQDAVPRDQVVRISHYLGRMFPDGHIQPVSVNGSFSEDGRIASMMANFVLNSYSRYPGAWLVVDGPAVPMEKNFMTELALTHNSLRSPVSGRGEVKPFDVIPVGPVVLELPPEHLKPLRSPINQSWRLRGRHTFGRVGFGLVPLDAYPFRLESADEVPPEGDGDFTVRSLDDISDGDVPPDASALEGIEVETLTRNQLFNLMWWRTGTKPAHNISKSTLLERLQLAAQ